LIEDDNRSPSELHLLRRYLVCMVIRSIFSPEAELITRVYSFLLSSASRAYYGSTSSW